MEDSPGSAAVVIETVDDASMESTGEVVLEPSGNASGVVRPDEDVGTSSGSQRQGTISSARFNMWSTMVGGGSLSLPLAFYKTGNVLTGPLLLILTAGITEFCFTALIRSARKLAPPNDAHQSNDSFESIASAAFGTTMFRCCTVLVALMCFFGIVGYAVLLRDMLEPITDWVFLRQEQHGLYPQTADKITMLTVVVAVTPLCTLQTLTSLKRFGAASMCAILILGVCILMRSIECTSGYRTERFGGALAGFSLFPQNWKDVLDVLPLFISCYVCHYNIPVVHNELQAPTPERVRWWLRSTVWGSTIFYMVLGISGSAYSSCARDGIRGNILLNFPEEDPLLLIGRLCLAVTITLAFPMLTIPARDILIRAYMSRKAATTVRRTAGLEEEVATTLRQPLLTEDDNEDTADIEQPAGHNGSEHPSVSTAAPSLGQRLLAAVVVFWTAAAVATFVKSIDIVWDFLGSSLSIILSHLIPCGCFLVIDRKPRGERTWWDVLSIATAWLLILLFVPLMLVSTVNAAYNTFFNH